MRLARFLADACKDSGLEVAGIAEAPLLPLGRGNLPSVLAELGYLSNPSDQALLQDPDGQERLATALYNGLKNFADERKETRK
jgi:N-acetylmuramoyl-L-alanine amidase